MSRFPFKKLLVGLGALACLLFASISNAEAIRWATVGDPGNTADTDPDAHESLISRKMVAAVPLTWLSLNRATPLRCRRHAQSR